MSGKENVFPLEMVYLCIREESPVKILLKGRSEHIEGVIMGVDEHMNLTVRGAEEVGVERVLLKEAFLRGDGILAIECSLKPRKVVAE
jgi:small nuclear ribonucleoprotein (snRNP)-like protein